MHAKTEELDRYFASSLTFCIADTWPLHPAEPEWERVLGRLIRELEEELPWISSTRTTCGEPWMRLPAWRARTRSSTSRTATCARTGRTAGSSGGAACGGHHLRRGPGHHGPPGYRGAPPPERGEVRPGQCWRSTTESGLGHP
ncbi:MAG: hypothetical protein MZV65_15820 [Chromatiales bacterium]|nr:hypothetical protein [Chromatiales bacterium]